MRFTRCPIGRVDGQRPACAYNNAPSPAMPQIIGRRQVYLEVPDCNDFCSEGSPPRPPFSATFSPWRFVLLFRPASGTGRRNGYPSAPRHRGVAGPARASSSPGILSIAVAGSFICSSRASFRQIPTRLTLSRPRSGRLDQRGVTSGGGQRAHTCGPCFETLASGASDGAHLLLSMRSLLWI